MTDDNTAQADQDAAATRERDRRLRAIHDGELVTVRAIQIVTDPAELEARERGEVPDGVQARIDRQLAEDKVITAIRRDREDDSR